MILSLLFYLLLLFIFLKGILHYRNLFIIKLPWYVFILETWAVVANFFKINVGLNGFVTLFPALYLLYYFISCKKHKNANFNKIFAVSTIFLLYLSTRTHFSIDYESMITRFCGYVILFGLMIIASREIRLRSHFNLLLSELEKIGMWYIIFTVIFSLIHIGENMYHTGIVYGYSHMQPNSIAAIAVVLGIFGIFGNNKLDSKKVAISILMMLILILTLRRTYLMIIAAMLIPFILFHIKRLKRFIPVILVFTAAIIFLISGVGSQRDKFTEMDIENEGRFVEFLLVNEKLEQEDALMLGDGEMFITRGKYGLSKEDRPLHTGHAELVLGSGYIGLSLFILIFVILLIMSLSNFNRNKSPIFPIVISFFFVFFILTLSGGIRSPSAWIISVIYISIYNLNLNYGKTNYIAHSGI